MQLPKLLVYTALVALAASVIGCGQLPVRGTVAVPSYHAGAIAQRRGPLPNDRWSAAYGSVAAPAARTRPSYEPPTAPAYPPAGRADLPQGPILVAAATGQPVAGPDNTQVVQAEGTWRAEATSLPPQRLSSEPASSWSPTGSPPNLLPAAPSTGWQSGGELNQSRLRAQPTSAPDSSATPLSGTMEPAAWVRGEYLSWRIKGVWVPALVTASPLGTPQAKVGVLGKPNTSLLLGNLRIDDDDRPGARFSFGTWLDDCHRWGIDGGFFFLDQDQFSFQARSNGDPALARPFYNVQTHQQDAELVSLATTTGQNAGVALAGSVAVSSSTDVTGFNVNLRKNVTRCCRHRLDALLGFRYLELDESLKVQEQLTVIDGSRLQPPNASSPGTLIDVTDRFDTDTRFTGAQMGLVGQSRRGNWWLEWTAKVALGTSHKRVVIDGQTTKTQPGEELAPDRGGLLALPTNIGRHKDHEFAVLPELGINVGYHLTDNLRAFAGYTFIYLSNAARPGKQIDLSLNTSQINGGLQGQARPQFRFEDEALWIYGWNVGLEWRF